MWSFPPSETVATQEPSSGPELPPAPKYERGAAPQPSREEATLATAAAQPTASPQLPRGRRFGLGGVYAVLIVLAALPLVGRAASQLLAARQEE
jgi:hypothetical protein